MEYIYSMDTYAFIGLFEAGVDESGDWQWVDGADNSWMGGWQPGEVN